MRLAHALLFFALPVAASLTATACARQGPPVLAPVETAEIGDAGATAALTIAPPLPSRDQCSARLRAAPIKTNEGCTLDERISKGNGVLVFPCSGAGEVEAVFGEHRFRGTVNGSNVQLQLTTELDWDDGCHWETQQAIRGEWRREGKHPKLVWTYEEHPVSGTGCFQACKAKADIEVDELTQ